MILLNRITELQRKCTELEDEYQRNKESYEFTINAQQKAVVEQLEEEHIPWWKKLGI